MVGVHEEVDWWLLVGHLFLVIDLAQVLKRVGVHVRWQVRKAVSTMSSVVWAVGTMVRPMTRTMEGIMLSSIVVAMCMELVLMRWSPEHGGAIKLVVSWWHHRWILESKVQVWVVLLVSQWMVATKLRMLSLSKVDINWHVPRISPVGCLSQEWINIDTPATTMMETDGMSSPHMMWIAWMVPSAKMWVCLSHWVVVWLSVVSVPLASIVVVSWSMVSVWVCMGSVLGHVCECDLCMATSCQHGNHCYCQVLHVK